MGFTQPYKDVICVTCITMFTDLQSLQVAFMCHLTCGDDKQVYISLQIQEYLVEVVAKL